MRHLKISISMGLIWKIYNEQNSEKEFEGILGNIITPIYISASNMGFIDWDKRNYEIV